MTASIPSTMTATGTVYLAASAFAAFPRDLLRAIFALVHKKDMIAAAHVRLEHIFALRISVPPSFAPRRQAILICF